MKGNLKKNGARRSDPSFSFLMELFRRLPMTVTKGRTVSTRVPPAFPQVYGPQVYGIDSEIK
jgi:hypothetical protein